MPGQIEAVIKAKGAQTLFYILLFFIYKTRGKHLRVKGIVHYVTGAGKMSRNAQI